MQHKPLSIYSAIILLCLLSAPVTAAEVTLALKKDLSAIGEYHEGEAGKAAVLVLHGFLQTHRFSTVRLISNELTEAGYTVLRPTLTLNIDRRRNSLTCDAIQNHTVEEASDEIAAWVQWLKQQGHQRIILIGHSTGSNNLLSYLQNSPDPAIAAFIATSVGPMDSGDYSRETQRQLVEASKDIASGDIRLKQYTLGFCRNNYTTTPQFFLSYMQWREDKILNALKDSPVTTTVVLGRADKWLPTDWPTKVADQGIPLSVIDEASHYFNGISEFDFQATILSLVEEAEQGS